MHVHVCLLGFVIASCAQEQYSVQRIYDLERQLESSEALVADFQTSCSLQQQESVTSPKVSIPVTHMFFTKLFIHGVYQT